MTRPAPPPPSSDIVRRPSLGLWAASVIGAALIHAGALAAILIEAPAEIADETGAPAFEIGIDLLSPKTETTELPPGPEAEASAASTASVQQEKPVEQVDLPKEVPTETAEAERQVAPETPRKPVEQVEIPVVARAESTPSQESVASEATAPAVIQAAREAPVSTAPVIGAGQADARIRAAWQRRLVTHLDRNKRHPGGAAQRNSQVVLSFTLDRTGRVVTASVVTSSGDQAFDQAALAMMRRADPVPAPPPSIADEGLTFTVPVVFRNKARG